MCCRDITLGSVAPIKENKGLNWMPYEEFKDITSKYREYVISFDFDSGRGIYDITFDWEAIDKIPLKGGGYSNVIIRFRH